MHHGLLYSESAESAEILNSRNQWIMTITEILGGVIP